MSLGSPRLERPEFVGVLNREIPYHQPHHTVRPGFIGRVRIRYKYGSSVEYAREKLRNDLFYIKNMLARLDLLGSFQAIKVILCPRGAE